MPYWTSASRLSPARLNATIPIIRVKAADETVTSNASPQDDDHLVAAVDANSTYLIMAYLVWTSTSATPDFRIDFTVPSGANIPQRSFFAQPTGNTSTTGTIDTGTTQSADGDDTRASVNGRMAGWLVGTLVVGSTAGDLQLRWAQGTSDSAGVTLKQYSWLRIEKVLH
jgi:hypothetical protein